MLICDTATKFKMTKEVLNDVFPLTGLICELQKEKKILCSLKYDNSKRHDHFSHFRPLYCLLMPWAIKQVK